MEFLKNKSSRCKDYSELIPQFNIKFIRAFSQGGFADLRQVFVELGFNKIKTKGKYKEIEDKISDALRLWKHVN